jgi:hypothetical protein
MQKLSCLEITCILEIGLQSMKLFSDPETIELNKTKNALSLHVHDIVCFIGPLSLITKKVQYHGIGLKIDKIQIIIGCKIHSG